MDTTMRDLFFKNVSEKRILTMRPADLLTALKKQGLRTRLRDARVPLDATLNGHGGMSATQVLLALRQQLDGIIRIFDDAVRRRIMYFFQFQLCPFGTRKLMPEYMGLTFMPGHHQTAFPSGSRFWPVEDLEALTLQTRLNRMVKRDGNHPFTIDHFDVRVLGVEAGSDGKVHLGGIGVAEDGTPYTRALLSRMIDFEPGRDPWSVPKDSPEVTDQAIALHGALEFHLAAGDPAQHAPILPSVYLGFGQPDDVGIEISAALESRALDGVRGWMRAGRPMGHPSYAWANQLGVQLGAADPDRLASWNDVVNLMGLSSSMHVLEDVWASSEIQHAGLTLLPASLFTPFSEQKPFETAKGAFVDLRDILGRKIVWPNGQESIDNSLARQQIVKLHEAEVPLKDEAGAWDYDFGTVEPELEEEFV